MKPLFFKIIITAGLLSLACTTKVSEWVLLNSIPSDYTLVYFHKDPLSDAEKQQHHQIISLFNHANIRLRSILRKDAGSPYALYYKNRLFSEYGDVPDIKSLTSSPLRKKIAGELMGGKLCVMLYLKTGIEAKDNSGREVINRSLAASPFGKIITVIELDRNDLNEKHFISMLLHVEDDLMGIREPMLFGIFGKFKALEPLLAGGITEENIRLMISFLTADCSCLIKDNLPGTDILFADEWQSPDPALVNKILDENPSLIHK